MFAENLLFNLGMYCLEGNITGATTILEHMKEEEMAINENVFHSLLMGHCINRDKESVMETLQVSFLLLNSKFLFLAFWFNSLFICF